MCNFKNFNVSHFVYCKDFCKAFENERVDNCKYIFVNIFEILFKILHVANDIRNGNNNNKEEERGKEVDDDEKIKNDDADADLLIFTFTLR